MKKTILRCFLAGLAFFLWTSTSIAANPWSGYWWPLSRGELIFGYNSDTPTLQKYDLLVSGYKPGPATMESYNRQLNYSASAGSWFGLCNGWAAAAIMTQEPTKSTNVQGITFSVGDQKGLLSEAWYNTSGDGWFKGSRYYGNSGDDLQDLYPDDLWLLLQTYVRDQETPFVLDLSADEQVWNYPVYSYDLSGTHIGNGYYDCTLYIECADDGVQPDFVGIQKISKTYTFRVQLSNGKIVSGTGYWTGNSVKDHPDFAWYPGSQPAIRNSKLSYSTIQTICGGGGGGGTTDPVPIIRANGYTGHVTINYGDPLSVTIGVNPGSYNGQNADWWVVLYDVSDDKWYSFVYPKGWYTNIYRMIQYPLFSFDNFQVFYDKGNLNWGDYIFYFVIDGIPDGNLNVTWYNAVQVTVQYIIINED